MTVERVGRCGEPSAFTSVSDIVYNIKKSFLAPSAIYSSLEIFCSSSLSIIKQFPLLIDIYDGRKDRKMWRAISAHVLK